MNNLEMLRKRLKYEGGNQEGRMIKDKYNTFKKALLYSYQAADVCKLGETETRKALINPDKNKQDYDDKILSIDYAYGYKPGDIFAWGGTNTYWLVYLRELTEDAYLRAEIRRCKYQLQWINENKELVNTWCYIRGPVETKINSIAKAGVTMDTPNWTLELYIPATEENLAKFKERYATFMFDGKSWEVQVTDSVSMEGVLQVIALEHYVNDTLDNVEEGIEDYFQVVPVLPETGTEYMIGGNTFIKPLFSEEYTAEVPGGEWSVLEPNRPVELIRNDEKLKLTWTNMTSGQFTLQYTINDETYQKVIAVESLF